MPDLVTIKERKNPFEFHASEFLGDVPSLEHLELMTDAPVGALCYVINTGYTYLQARPGDWKQLKLDEDQLVRPDHKVVRENQVEMVGMVK